MNYKTGLISLGSIVTITLLLPTHTQANTLSPLEDADGQLSVLASVEPLSNKVLEMVAEEVVPAAIVADSNQLTQSPELTTVEPVNASVNTSSDNNDNASAEDLLLQPFSTNSSDLQPIEASLDGESGFQTPLAQPLDIVQATSEPSQLEELEESEKSERPDQWHFLVVPYIYVPFNISGSATFNGTEEFRNSFSGDFDNPSRDFEFSPSEIRTALENSLNFAFLGAVEAWTPNYNIGILANVDYVSLSSEQSFTRSVRRPGFANFIPTELDAGLDTQVWNVDLAASYRFYDPAKANPEGIRSEYDLGPFVFDVLGGLSLVSLNADLDLSTNLGGEGEFSKSQTVISPLLGGRFRWNATPTLAVVLSGAVSGFGIDGLTRYSVQGGVNWMFSGNTSLGAGYRFGFLDYSSDQIDLNVDQNGPYLSLGFRF